MSESKNSVPPNTTNYTVTSEDDSTVRVGDSVITLESGSEIQTLPVKQITGVRAIETRQNNSTGEWFRRRLLWIFELVIISLLGASFLIQDKAYLLMTGVVVLGGGFVSVWWLIWKVSTQTDLGTGDDTESNTETIIISTASDSMSFKVPTSEVSEVITSVYQSKSKDSS